MLVNRSMTPKKKTLYHIPNTWSGQSMMNCSCSCSLLEEDLPEEPVEFVRFRHTGALMRQTSSFLSMAPSS
jgi:hypothetical protein